MTYLFLYPRSHLFWPPASPDGTHRFSELQPVYAKSLECMKRAIKIIRENNPNPALFVEILDRYIYHFEHDVSIIYLILKRPSLGVWDMRDWADTVLFIIKP